MDFHPSRRKKANNWSLLLPLAENTDGRILTQAVEQPREQQISLWEYSKLEAFGVSWGVKMKLESFVILVTPAFVSIIQMRLRTTSN